MTLFVNCPHCGASHQAPPAMAGQQAQCRCGRVLTVPGSDWPLQLQVSCDHCGQQFLAEPTLAGQQLACSCGQLLTAPSPGRPPGSLMDELTAEDLRERPASADPLAAVAGPAAGESFEDEARRTEATAYAYAMDRVSKGASPQTVVAELMRDGIPSDQAQRIVYSVMPEDTVDVLVARAQGAAHFRRGALLLLAGVVLTGGVAIASGGAFTIVSGFLLVGGLFTMLYGALSFVLGKR